MANVSSLALTALIMTALTLWTVETACGLCIHSVRSFRI